MTERRKGPRGKPKDRFPYNQGRRDFLRRMGLIGLGAAAAGSGVVGVVLQNAAEEDEKRQ
ncbi:hypothetical protein A3J15_03615 [Candidatus Roizmanbacteria bacterium RIFCSPLOWO2_02_FULL_38_10]|uniref:Ubiquitinol-cytochrome C reductase Fe-S subunit TAT signal domain-containing protein n=1 Tax=Candidatus Roizmanbacteria bacterium RIFCSPLOWO2_02_FULL_38_10 TaxID=1802074 RepID=A0A1F7JJU7_9BACT|nr:MAG: hypothetical protein A3J15_03615 [Candidatus Roizmanbacteria bacterium RIFCSPLOWO2_02_FULL_38_10]